MLRCHIVAIPTSHHSGVNAEDHIEAIPTSHHSEVNAEVTLRSDTPEELQRSKR